MQSASTFGFVYVATGERYRREAAECAASLKSSTPNARICLITDKVEGTPFWDDVVLLDAPDFSFRDKIEMRRCPYDRFVFLDTDAHPIGDLNDLFVMLQRFDFIGHQLFEGHDIPMPGIPDAFPEFNTGVLGFRRGAASTAFFDRWKHHYTAFVAQNRDGHYHHSNVSDQKSFRVAVWESELSIGVIGPEYNFVPHHLNFACSPVRVLHNRSSAEREKLQRRINRKLGNRVYVPSLDAIISNSAQSQEVGRLWWGATLALIGSAARMVAPARVRRWARELPVARALFCRNRFMSITAAEAGKWRRPVSREA